MAEISVLIPVYNEGSSLEDNLRKIIKIVSGLNEHNFKVIIINDGSSPKTWESLNKLEIEENRLEILTLTRNFGKEAAISAGLDYAKGDAAVIMDSDLQHPPELIADMLVFWQKGYFVVEACKKSRGKESFLRRVSADGFYNLFSFFTGQTISSQSDFKLLDKKVIDTYCSLPERRKFFRGLVTWMGYPTAQIKFDVPDNVQSKSSWSIFKLWQLSVDALTGFSSTPLYLIIFLGLVCFFISLAIGGLALYYKFTGQAVSGFTTVILLLMLIGSFVMFGLGLIGIYLGQVFEEVKRRPVYIIDKQKSCLDDEVAKSNFAVAQDRIQMSDERKKQESENLKD